MSLHLADAVTNIEDVYCLLDFDDQGQNPDTTAYPAFVSCASIGSLNPEPPRRPDPSVSRPRSYSGTLTLSKLAPGQHRLWYSATDFWGHGSNLSVVAFTVDATESADGRFGHVIAIGHDYPANPDAQTLVGNSVLLMVPAPLSRPLRVLGLDLGQVDADATEGTPPKQAVLDSIATRAQALGLPPIDYREWSGDDAQPDEGVAAHLYGRDVLLIYDQNNPERSAGIGAKQAWLSALRDFVNAGGVVIVLDGLSWDGSYSGTLAIVGNAGPGSPDNLLESGLVAAFPPGIRIDLVCRSDSPLAFGVGTIPEPRHYSSPGVAILQRRDPNANEIFCNHFSCDPVVQDRKYPLRTDQGPVRVQAFGLDPTFDESAERGSGRDYAIYSSPDGAVEATCPLTLNGSSSHDVSAGGTVTVASTNGQADFGTGYGGSLDLESVFDVHLGETIIVGRQTNPPKLVDGGVEVEIPWYGNPNTAGYFVTNGCSNATTGQTPGENPIVALPTPTDECLSNGTEMSFLVEARDFNGDVLAYASLAGVVHQDFADCHGFVFSGWCVNAADWPVVTLPATEWASPQSPRLTIQYTGSPLPLHDLEAVQVLPRYGASHVGLEEGLSLDPAGGQYMVPKVPNMFADVLRVNGLVYSRSFFANGFSLTTDASDRALTPAGLPSTLFSLQRSRFLPRIVNAIIAGAPDRPEAEWLFDAGASPSGAQGGLGVVTYSASSSCCDPRDAICSSGTWAWHGSWSFVIPSSFPGNPGVTLPALPDELGCWRPLGGDSVLQSLAFLKIDTAAPDPTADTFRRSSDLTFRAHFDSLRTQVGEVGDETWMTAYCSQASYCSPTETPDSPIPSARVFPGCYTPPAVAAVLCH